MCCDSLPSDSGTPTITTVSAQSRQGIGDGLVCLIQQASIGVQVTGRVWRAVKSRHKLLPD